MTTNTKSLAYEALAHEGFAVFFGDLDPDTFDAVEVLADWLDVNGDRWTAATEDSAWSIDVDRPTLVDELCNAARAVGADVGYDQDGIVRGLEQVRATRTHDQFAAALRQQAHYTETVDVVGAALLRQAARCIEQLEAAIRRHREDTHGKAWTYPDDVRLWAVLEES